LCEKLFEKEQVFQPEEKFEYVHPTMTAGQAYHSITCLCGGAYLKDTEKGYKYCSECGLTDMLLEYVPEHSYENGPYCYRRSYHLYKRSNLLSERLSEFTNQSYKKPIPRAIFKLVSRKYKKDQITPNLIRNILKQNKLPQYYPAVHVIYRRCTGKSMAVLSGREISQITYWFSEVEHIFNDIKPSHRKAFLNYNFVICKLLQKIGRDDCCEYFKQLNLLNESYFMWKCGNREKLNCKQAIMEELCDEITISECNYVIIA
jgi:hypothetical protein